MGLKNREGRDIKDMWWKDGINTYLGMLVRGFPNCFMSYSPHGKSFINPCGFTSGTVAPTELTLSPAPTALSNGPTILECQVDFVVDAIQKLEKESVRSIEPSAEAQSAWCNMISEMAAHTLFPLTNSWWTGGNIPGKKVQMLTYVGGIPKYEQQCRETLNGWKGFEIVSGSS
jgi:hypothetical protein